MVFKKKNLLILFFGFFLVGFSGVLFFFSDFIVEATHNPSGSNVSSIVNEHWAWNDVVGWFDFHTNDTVKVKSQWIEGYASSSANTSSATAFSLDCATSPNVDICASANYKVLNDGCGALSGWAWNEVYGWASFCGTNILADSSADCPYNPVVTYRATIDSSGDFKGYAWSDVIGWISFNCIDIGGQPFCDNVSNFKVKTTWIPTSTSAYLDSSTFDTGVLGGAQLNSIMWLGGFTSATSTTCTGGATIKVGFQIAASSTPNGPWNFIGWDNSSSTFYASSLASEPGVSIPLDYTLHNNQRYFRYRVFLFSDQSQTQSPRVDDVIINWSP